MKLSTPEIVWHGKEPVFSADFHRNGAVWRLATAGADQDVKVGAKQFNIAESLAEVNLFKINIPTDLEGGEERRQRKRQNENIVYGQPFQAH